jgi:cysteine sulfinate desulfinase/cysteine desulfurase-like protein
MATFSGHKVHGDKGVGFVWISEDVDVKPLIYGGGQERGVRGGTGNLNIFIYFVYLYINIYSFIMYMHTNATFRYCI